jgi:phage FluMu gp28-like protein
MQSKRVSQPASTCTRFTCVGNMCFMYAVAPTDTATTTTKQLQLSVHVGMCRYKLKAQMLLQCLQLLPRLLSTELQLQLASHCKHCNR